MPAEPTAAGVAITVDYDSLTIDEIDLVEEVAGASLDEMMAGKVRTGKVLRAFALIALRRSDPQATVEQAGKISVGGLGALLGAGPTVAAGPPATPRSGSSRKPAASPSTGSRD